MEATIRAGGDSLGAQSPSATIVHNVLAIIANTEAITYICGAFRCHHRHLKVNIFDVKCYAFIPDGKSGNFLSRRDSGTFITRLERTTLLRSDTTSVELLIGLLGLPEPPVR